MDRIGLTFADELTAAGVPLDGISWDRGSGAILACPDAALAQVRAVLARHDPARLMPFDLAAYIAAGHAALRDGGVTVSGMRIKTDAESRGLIDGAYALSQAQPEKTIDFKASSGWASIDSQTMQTVAVAVGQWVQACYSAYRRLDEGRVAGAITTTAQVDAAYAAVTLPS